MPIGVVALAAELHTTPQAISWHFARGRTAQQVREHFKRKQEQAEAVERVRREFAPDKEVGGGPRGKGKRKGKVAKAVKSKGAKADASTAKYKRSTDSTGNSPLGTRLRPPVFARNTTGATSGTVPGAVPPGTESADGPAQASAQARPAKTYEQVLSEIAGRRQKREHIDDARARKVSAQADAQELQNAVKRGELIEAARVRLLGTGVVKESVGILERMPGQIQDRLSAESGVPAARCGAIVLEEVKRAVDKIREMEDIWRTK
jgi:hypothetical protein